jgi:hypothetical protein
LGLGQLEDDIRGMVMARRVTTVGEEECEELVNEELGRIVGNEFEEREVELNRMGVGQQQQVFLVKIMQCLI